MSAPHTHGHVIRWAPYYDGVVGLIALGRERELRQRTVALAAIEPRARVLEVGCGTGSVCIAAALAVPTAEILGTDPAPEMVQFAANKAAKAKVDASFEVGVIERIERESGSFDVVLSSLMLHHLPQDTASAGLAEVFRVLTPGGRLVVVDCRGPGPWLHRIGSIFTRGRDKSTPRVERIVEELKDLGFEEPVLGCPGPGYLFSIVARKPA